MEKEEINRFLKCRKDKSLSRQEASYLISSVNGVEFSPQKIQRIEEKPEEDVLPQDVLLMADGYSCPDLKYYYCNKVCPLGFMMPHVSEKYSLPQAVLSLTLALENVQGQQNRLKEIVVDGKVDKYEQKEFKKIQRELQKLSDMYQTILLKIEEQEQ